MSKGKTRRSGIGHAISRVLLTLLLIGVLCGCFCGIAFAYYVHAYINPSAQEAAVELSKGLGLNLNSFIYATDAATGEQKVYETLSGLENREWVDSEKIPQYMKNAAVAVEDKRFYKHNGVDWKGTLVAVKTWLLGGPQRGGSTITQQLIKNATDEDDYSVKRKINEIFRALALEKEIDDKDRILTMYLNTIYLGYHCYGVQTAAERYFSKDVSELTLAESAAIVGMTNNPSIYDAYNHPDKVKERQEEILGKMLEQEMITQAEHDEAVAQELAYRPYEDYVEEVGEPYSYFTDAVITDVVNDLMTQKGYSETVARNMVNSGGLQIYATIDTRVQDILDSVYKSNDVFPNMTRGSEDSKPQSAMVITDKQGNIVALVGGRGEKTGKLTFSRATDARRQPGSSLKPLAAYGPAMDKGIIVPSSIAYDKPLRIGTDGKPWPMNDGKMPTGSSMTIKSGITSSVNTIAVQVMSALTPQASYDFLTQRLGFQLVGNRTNADGSVQSDIDYAPLALGGLTDGVTVREMAGGFSAFINDGVFGGTRTYSKVVDSEGNVVLENKPSTDLGFENVRTAYYMLECLQNVTAYGTASGIQIPGVQTAGKTGTTTDNKDIWFCGVTPKYSAAVWVGFDAEYRVDGLYGRNAAYIWLDVMKKVHEGDSGLKFDSHPQDFVEKTYCMDTGLLASGACRAAGRAATGRFWKDQVPAQTCSHQNIGKTYNFAKIGVTDWKQEDEEEDKDKDKDKDKGKDNAGTDPTIDPETGKPVTPPTDPEGGGTVTPAPDPQPEPTPEPEPEPMPEPEPEPAPDDPEA